MIFPQNERTTLGEILYKMFYGKSVEEKKKAMLSEEYLLYENLFGKTKLKEYYDRHVKKAEEQTQAKEKSSGNDIDRDSD